MGWDLVQLLVVNAIPIAFIGQLQDDSNRVPENINGAHTSIFAAVDPADYVASFSAELRGPCPAQESRDLSSAMDDALLGSSIPLFLILFRIGEQR